MSTAIIGVGNIGKAVATHLTEGGQAIVLAAGTPSEAEQLARELGPSASAADVAGAIDQADAVIFAVWLNVLEDLVRQNAAHLSGKVVIDPSNPVAMDANGQFSRTLPQAHLPTSRVVRAFNMLGAADMSGDGRPEGDPERRALALAGDNQEAKQLVARLYNEFGFDTVDIGGLDESWRVDVGQPAFVTRQNVAELEANVAKAKRCLDPGLTPVPDT
jgi:predicted dinucleotide-binding enzyme